MKNINASRWVEITANLGIVAGLLLVAAQMKQTADLQRLEMVHRESRGMVELEKAMLGENPAAVWAKSLKSFPDLTIEERRIMDAYYYTFAEQLRSTFFLEQEGLLEKGETLRRIQLDSRYYFGNPYGLGWWRGYKGIQILPKELTSAIDNELDVAGITTITMAVLDSPFNNMDKITKSNSAAKPEE